MATHLALAAALPAALAQFVTEHMLGVAMLWTALLAWIWIIFEPSVFAGETVSRARARVLGRMLRDPFACFLVVATLFAFIRWLNSGIDLFYDAEKTSRIEAIDKAVEEIRSRYGYNAIKNAALLDNPKMPLYNNAKLIMPTGIPQ